MTDNENWWVTVPALILLVATGPAMSVIVPKIHDYMADDDKSGGSDGRDGSLARVSLKPAVELTF